LHKRGCPVVLPMLNTQPHPFEGKRLQTWVALACGSGKGE
jgi:hypothetical protein